RGQRQDTWLRRALGGGVLAVLAVVGARVAFLLGQAADAWAMPGILVAGMGGGVLGLFAGLGTAAAHLSPPLDPVEAALERALTGLTGELAEAARRALDRYRHCARILSQLPPDPSREALAETLARTTQDVARLAEEWAGLERLLAEVKTESLD